MGGAAAVHQRDDVVGALQVQQREGVVDLLLVQLVGEVLLQRGAVDGPGAGAGHQAHAHDGLLAAADGLDGTTQVVRLVSRRDLFVHLYGLVNHGGLGGLVDGLSTFKCGLGHCATCLISNGIGC